MKIKTPSLRKDFKRRRRTFDKVQSEIRSDLLMSGVAHEFNNILGAADGHAEWALDSKNVDDMVEALKVVRIACQRSASITKALRGVSQPREESEEVFELAEVISELKAVIQPYMQKTAARLNLHMPKKIKLQGIKNEVIEVFLNLMKNSLEAAHSSGITPELKIEASVKARKVLIKFWDNGPGVPRALDDLIFQPFFTTKGVLGNIVPGASALQSTPPSRENFSSGTGLGLFWSRKICQEMSGSLTLKREKDSNRCYFEVSLRSP